MPPKVEDLLRELAPQVLGALVRRYGDFDAAEDATQEGLLAAALHWPRNGIPPKPRAWLVQTATRRLIDHWRSDRSRRDRESLAALEAVSTSAVSDQDDTLIVLFMCCHPALTPASAIALTLRAVGGLTTAEIANAFLVDEATMAQRISRAKARIKASGVPFRMPTREDQAAQVRTVLHVLYLIFNEGYTSSAGREVHRTELSEEAIRLTRMVQRMLPDDGEVMGLLALMLLIDARRPARTNAAGELIPLPEQDRTLWDQALIVEGIAMINAAVGMGAVGEYQLQAAIAAVHDQAPQAADTDWRQILALYGLLEQMTGNPVVTLNRAVAAAMVDGPAAGLALLDAVDERLTGHYRLDAVRAHLLEMAGDMKAALAHYRAAAQRTTNLPEQRYLAARAARLRLEATASGDRFSSQMERIEMNMDDFPAPKDGFVLTHFLVVSDQDRSRAFYQSLFDGQVLLERDPVMMKVANSWLILNEGGGPTDDKPTVTLTTPPDPNRTSAFLNVRVADIWKVYKDWSAKGAEFLTEPKDHGREIRAYVRDPDGHLIEVGQTTGLAR